VSRPAGFADLAGRRVGLFGYGVEGRAARALLEGTCDLVVVDDRDLGDGVLVSARGGLEALATCDVVLKSPGIPRRRDDVRSLEARGVVVTSALNLWLGGADRSRVAAVTGTKGKSTTTSLTAFFLTALGRAAVATGNLGRPPYDRDVVTAGRDVVVEVSSFQSVDLEVAPGVVVVTSLASDHLDWHGDVAQYRADKLAITRAPGAHRTLLAEDATLRAHREQVGGDVEWVRPDTTGLARRLGLLGAHNDQNVALALAAAAALAATDVAAVRAAASRDAERFTPLPGRLTLVATERRDGATISYVDDGLATSPLPTLAALAVFDDRPVALLAGGFDRGVDYRDLARAIAGRPAPTSLIAMGPAGERLAAALRALSPRATIEVAPTMGDAVAAGRQALDGGGVVLFSPAAPSFDRYTDWVARSADFCAVVRASLA
jgi:UDP-N-acetylmuramoyl-L-alanine---L-glutamate ligase